MKKSTTSDNSDAVGLFPFLAVLLCTMGALLVLLVVLAQRAGQRVTTVQAERPASTISNLAEGKSTEELAALAEQLKGVRQYQEQLRKLREQAEIRLHNEQLRLSHLEEHTRRLEHELARLSLAAKQLEATEKDQTVDQQQAERELARLQGLIKDTEKQLDELRDQAVGKKSYAIVPYKGPNGTYRRPVYIECCREGVILHPEGIKLESSDFALPAWPGNPLAAALRATREHLNAKAAKAGEPEPPDPYPLLLVRPDGITQYSAARAAITSWDADFGYEFIDGDWKLDFPELPDPQLARVQEHALLNAREHLARLARAAPSRFRGVGFSGSGSSVSGGSSNSDGYNAGGDRESDENRVLAQLADGEFADGNGNAVGQAEAGTEVGDDQFQLGAMGGGSSEGGKTDATGGSTGGQSGESAATAATDGSTGSEPNAASGANSLAQSGNQSATGGGSDASSSASSFGGAATGGQTSASGSASTSAGGSSSLASIAESRGHNWAVDRKTGGVPLRRPIHVVVRKDRLALLPSRHANSGAEATGTVISLSRPLSQVSDEFVAALRTRIDEWGLAGNGLYWRPVLKLYVAPDAQDTAFQLTSLLKDSGVELRLPETAQVNQSGPDQSGDRVDATR